MASAPTPELVTPQMRADILAAHDEILRLVAHRDQLRAELDASHERELKLRLALSLALESLRHHGEHQLYAQIERSFGYGERSESVADQMQSHGLVLVVDNDARGS